MFKRKKNHFSGKSHILFLAEKMVTSLERVFTKENFYVGLIFGDPGVVNRVGRKGGTKVFKYGRKSPWVPTLTELFPKIQAHTPNANMADLSDGPGLVARKRG